MAAGTIPTAPRAAGSAVADFELRAADGKTYATRTARQNGLLLIALFKTGCGTCQYAFPYLQRFHEQYAQNAEGRFQVWGVSQDNAEDTQAFAKVNGNTTFPILLDEDLRATAQYGITNVPDLYLLSSEETIPFAVLGQFAKDAFNELAQRVADFVGVPYVPIVRDADNAPAIKPG
jgi:peroxiredoxin